MLNIDDFTALIFWVIIILTGVSTFYDVYSIKLGLQQQEMFTTFSLSKNFKQLIKINSSTSIIRSVDAIKVIAAYWVIIGHREITSGTSSRFFLFFLQFKKRNQLSVDTFLACSGILVCQSILRSFERKDFNIFKMYINRFFRYFPSIALLLMFVMSSLPLEFADNTHKFALANVTCSLSWKSTLFMTQNLNEDLNTNCLQHLWYLSLDYQLFLMSPIFVLVLKRFGKRGVYATTALIVVLCYQIYHRYSHSIFSWYEYYVSTHYRLPEYLVGIIFGYFIHNTKTFGALTKRSLMVSYAGWILSIGFIYFHFYEIIPSYFDQTGQQMFASASRALWSLAVCYVIFACHLHQTGGIIRWFLSLDFWQPLSKIGLSVYIVHAMYQFATEGGLAQKSAFGMFWNFMIHVSDMLCSTVLGLMLYLLVEAPTVYLLSVLWRQKQQKLGGNKVSLTGNPQSYIRMKELVGYFKM